MSKWEERQKVIANFCNLSDEDLRKELEKFESIKQAQQEKYRAIMRENNENNVDSELIAIKEEIEDRKQRNGEELVEGTRWHLQIDILHDRKKYPFGERDLETYLKSLPGVKDVRIHGDCDEIDIIDLEDIFYEYFEK